MTSADFSFLSNVKKEKEGLEMINSVKEKAKKDSFECRECGSNMVKSYQTYDFHYEVGEEKRKIDVLNAPCYKCKTCDNEVVSVLLYADMEKAIEKEIFFRLNNRQEIPNEMNFEEFLK